ncbi:YbaK/EbsC family protein [Salinibacterium sp. SYSU T00001]|uniref:aminoacyl-tRNA deacylase n=1 Tax=Homoserinimonas sedimenticola TaxID=2986805 RepID=UPI002235D76C|nr:YbaK/EbsC family protein [Salinibacterium sedimenticola]MCW4384569.1 YbaK/EbsC family protein [Salinibacterium sedimenticola]
MTALTGTARVAAAATELGLDIQLVEGGPVASLEEAAASLGIEPSHVIKSLVVKRKDGGFLFALVPGDRQISWSKLRTVVGVNKLSLPDAHTAYEATGYERGTITPLGSSTAWPVYADERMRGRRVSLGAGAHHTTFFVDADELLAALDATVADITEAN